ncbi:MAG: hypothetical protein ACKVHE_03225 [Planctomycetales bacterium]|jgi:hypothetical protein
MAAPTDIRQREFGSTDWSMIRQLDGPNAELALAKLCEQYWQPLYAYARSKVRDVHKTPDLTQGFFAAGGSRAWPVPLVRPGVSEKLHGE